LEESRDEQLDHAAGIVARIVVVANAEVADATHQFLGITIGTDLASLGGGVEQLSANGHEAVKEVGMQRVEADALGLQDRGVDLQMRVSAPVTGRGLPIILFSHGHGNSCYLSSLNGYGPLADFWAAHGIVVIQPTHLDSRALGLRDAPGGPLFWRSRAQDMKRILDQLDLIEASVPELSGRMDRSRIATVGHSLGGYTTGMLLGARLTDPKDGREVDMADSRIKAGVLLAAPGRGEADLSAFAAEHYSFFLHTSFAEMTTPALVVAGDKDVSPHLSVATINYTRLIANRSPSKVRFLRSLLLQEATTCFGSLPNMRMCGVLYLKQPRIFARRTFV
jgi:Alpha/beta hydrolase family